MGNMVRVQVTVRGTRPLLQHGFGEDAIPLQKGERTGVAGNDPEEWRKTMLVTPDGELYVPDSYVFGCLRDAAKHTKKGKGSYQALVAATLQIEEPAVMLGRRMPAGDPRINAFSDPVYIDRRGVRNPSTKGRNVRYRLACSKGWEVTFTLAWDKTVVPRDIMRIILKDASVLVGLADGRSIGYGRFEVLKWEELTDAEESSTAGSVAGDAEESLAPRRRKVRAVSAAAEADGVPH